MGAFGASSASERALITMTEGRGRGRGRGRGTGVVYSDPAASSTHQEPVASEMVPLLEGSDTIRKDGSTRQLVHFCKSYTG